MKRLTAVIFLFIFCSLSFAEEDSPTVITNIDTYSPTNPKTNVIRIKDKALTEKAPALPANEATVSYYEKPSVGSGIKFITADLNGVPVEMLFDTGASTIVVNKETFDKLSISGPLKQVTAHTAGGNADNYTFELSSVKIGSIEVSNVITAYAPTSEENLLGGSFLNKFKYLIDEKRKVIIFTPKE